MKKDIKPLKFTPFEIELEDDRLFTQVAYLLDGTGIITEIYEIRERFKIKESFKYDDFKSWDNHILELSGFDIEEYWKMEKIEPNKDGSSSKWKIKSKWLQANEKAFFTWAKLRDQYSEVVSHARRIYRYPKLFDQVVSQAVLFNKVGYFKSAIARLTYEPEYAPVAPDVGKEDTVLSIMVSPYSTMKDIQEAFENCKTGELREIYESKNPSETKLNADTKSSIRQHREWYWMNHPLNPNVMGYKRIAKFSNQNLETVKSGIKSYHQFISSAL